MRSGVAAYHRTRNQLGEKAGSRLSPWLALGCLSPRAVYAATQAAPAAEEGAFKLFFELCWRDYFRFYCARFGREVFFAAGPAKKKKINPFETMMAQERPVNSYLEDPASFKSGGVTGLPDVRAHTVPPVKGLVVFHDFVTADEERDLVRAVEPVLEGGNHISGAGRVHRHKGYGTENQGGYPCVMNRRAEKVWAGTPRAGTYEKVPIKGPEPPAEAPPPIPEWARPLARSIKDLGLPAFLPTRLDCLRYTPPDGQIGAHSDDPWSGPTVCLLTLAAETVMTFELKDSERKLARYRNLAPVRVRLPPRSLLVFTGDARWKFNHSIKPADIKYGAAGQRISLTFRATTMPDEWSKWRCQPDGSCTASRPCALCTPPWLY